MVEDKQGLQRRAGGCALLFNITSAVGHKVVLIPDFFTPLSMYSYFSVLLEVLTRTSNSKNVLFI